MKRFFNTEGCCLPEMHYMVNLESRLSLIKQMIDQGKYFTINRGRQYGKTTTLKALKKYLADSYAVVSVDFQGVSVSEFCEEHSFVKALARELLMRNRNVFTSAAADKLNRLKSERNNYLADLFYVLSSWCETSEKPAVLLVDEVDQASDNQVFLDFLAQLRLAYLDRTEIPAFQSVILAGVHDIRNIRQKIRNDKEHKHNSPWNIAASFEVDMSFSVDDISGMLSEYEKDNSTGMDIEFISQLIYSYSSGYPVLVSDICRKNDENTDGKTRWTRDGIVKAVGEIVMTRTPLFESLINKVEDNESLKKCVYDILINGEKVNYSLLDSSVNLSLMYGFTKVSENILQISNKIFETMLYNFYLTSGEMQNTRIFREGTYDKNQFTENGFLDMDKVLEKFVVHFNEIFAGCDDKFIEERGREQFLLYLRPIINGTGNYYIEPQTRDKKRMDIVVDYLGKQFIIELKIWHGEKYNLGGENQLCGYLERMNIKKGYLVSFNFNRNKKSGLRNISVGDKIITEAIV